MFKFQPPSKHIKALLFQFQRICFCEDFKHSKSLKSLQTAPVFLVIRPTCLTSNNELSELSEKEKKTLRELLKKFQEMKETLKSSFDLNRKSTSLYVISTFSQCKIFHPGLSPSVQSLEMEFGSQKTIVLSPAFQMQFGYGILGWIYIYIYI